MEFKVVSFESPLYEQSVELRDKLLRIPLGLPRSRKIREQEREDLHAVAIERNQVVAAALLRKNGNNRMKMRQVAVERAFQGKGLGRQLVHFAEKTAKFNGCAYLELYTRKIAAEFYRKQGYSNCGDEFEEMGIPHLPMEKDLYPKEL